MPSLAPDIDFADPRVAVCYDELPWWSAPFGALLLDNVPLAPGLRVLDVGCGTGFPLFELAHRLGPSCELVGIDVWAAALDRARFKLNLYATPRLTLIHADAANLPFPAAHFDLIISNLGINNFADPARALAECFRVARPGATLALTTNVQGHMRELYTAYRAALADLGAEEYLPTLNAQEAHRTTRPALTTLIEAAGFRVTRHIEHAFTQRYLDGAALLNHWWIRLGFLPGWRAVVAPTDEDRVFTALQARLDAQAALAGEPTMTIPMLYLEAARPGDTP